MAQTPRLYSIPATKPPRTYRIFVLGGAAAMGGYRPGASLTEQTGRNPDTANSGQREYNGAHAMESEQCDGREAAVCL